MSLMKYFRNSSKIVNDIFDWLSSFYMLNDLDNMYLQQTLGESFSKDKEANGYQFLFDCGLSSHSRVVHSYGDVNFTGDWLQILTYARHSSP